MGTISQNEIEIQIGASGTASGPDDAVYFDDVKIYPSDAQFTSYTYDLNKDNAMNSKTEITSLHSKYSYDDLIRLSEVRNHDGDLIEKIHYNYNYEFPEFSVEPVSWEFFDVGGTKIFSVSSDGLWQVNESAYWLDIVETTSNTFTIYCEPNYTPRNKTTAINITSGNQSINIPIMSKKMQTYDPYLSGYVLDENGSPIEGVTIICTTGSCDKDETGPDGFYSIVPIPAQQGESITVSANHDDYIFSNSPYITYMDDGCEQHNFIGEYQYTSYTVSGSISTYNSNDNLSGIKIVFPNHGEVFTQNANGDFSCNLFEGYSGAFFAEKDGFLFGPMGHFIENLTNDIPNLFFDAFIIVAPLTPTWFTDVPPYPRLTPEGGILLKWNDVVGESGYIIERTNSGTTITIDNISADENTYLDENVSSYPESYSYKIKSFNAFGESGFSVSISYDPPE
ncbi:MAG: hypothetical protein R2764_23180 [Bacteroidales bacterium]